MTKQLLPTAIVVTPTGCNTTDEESVSFVISRKTTASGNGMVAIPSVRRNIQKVIGDSITGKVVIPLIVLLRNQM